MVTVTKTVRFDAAHVLTNHQGLCKNLHGHTYRVDVSVAQAADDGRDMVIDFKDLKAIANEVVGDRFDHAFIYDSTSPAESEIAAVVTKHGMRAVALTDHGNMFGTKLFYDTCRAEKIKPIIGKNIFRVHQMYFFCY